LHLLIINLVRVVAGTMIIFVFAIEVEDDGNAVLRVVVVIRTIEKPVRVFGVVVKIVERQVEVSVVGAFAQFSQLRAHHL
jgi:hypothetical protein